jgi:hypothetical protein
MNSKLMRQASAWAFALIITSLAPLGAQTLSLPAPATEPVAPAENGPEAEPALQPVPAKTDQADEGPAPKRPPVRARKGNRNNVMGQTAPIPAPAPAGPKNGFFARDTDAKGADLTKMQNEAIVRWQADAGRSWATAGTSRRTMVLPLSAAGSANLNHAHEDLRIMHRLLTKSLSSNPRNVEKFSIRLGAEDRQFDAMYLEGFGAVFLLSVDYPLVEPAKFEPKPAEPEPKDPDWAKEQRHPEGETDDGALVGQDFAGEVGATQPEFNPERVNRLRIRMTEAIKHASNIRTLKPKEEVVVVIAGRTQPKAFVFAPAANNESPKLVATVPVTPVATAGGAPAPVKWPVISSDRNLQSAMVLRVKKSVVDDLADSKINAEDFRSKIEVSTY